MNEPMAKLNNPLLEENLSLFGVVVEGYVLRSPVDVVTLLCTHCPVSNPTMPHIQSYDKLSGNKSTFMMW